MPTPPPQTDPSNERTLAAVAYILTWVTGIIILLVAKKDQHYARWHAIQAIGFGVATTVVSIVLNFVPIPFLSLVWGLLVIIGIIALAVKAYQGDGVRLPMVADMADKSA